MGVFQAFAEEASGWSAQESSAARAGAVDGQPLMKALRMKGVIARRFADASCIEQRT